MKKFFVFMSLLLTVLLLASCTEDVHSHQASSDWSKDATNHWHICTGCEELLDSAAHTYGEWSVVTAATEAAKGSEKRACNVCGYEETREIPQLSHTHNYSSDYSSNSTHHWYECACGDKKDMAEHSGGTATTEELAVCEVCGEPYGELVVVPPHECSYTDGVCECGKTEAGAYDKTVDGDLIDWSEEEKANALQTFGDSGTGFGVAGYHKDGKAYIAAMFVTEEASPTAFEIFQKDASTRYIIYYQEETDSWEGENNSLPYLIGIYGTRTVENGLNVFVVETIWDFSSFPREENGNYRIHFAASVHEKSAASYSDTQPEYWVLYGKNAWSPAWNFELTTTTEMGHEHLLDGNSDCIICNKNFKLTDLAVTLDGSTSDWDADILSTMLISYDEEDRWLNIVGFTDEKYLYMYISVAHRSPVGYLNIIVGSEWFGGIRYGSALTLDNVQEAVAIEYKDETGSFTVTDYEFVLSLDKIKAFNAGAVSAEGVKIGFDFINDAGENSHGFACDPNKLFMWGVAGYNSWSVAHNFVYGPNGVPHTHDWNQETETCKLCQAEMPKVQYDINPDGDLSDWSSDMVATSTKTYGTEGNGWEIMGYRVGTTAYLAVTIKTKGAVPALFGLVESSSAGYVEHTIKYNGESWVKCSSVVLLGSTLNNTDTIDTYVLELILDLSSVTPLVSGDYLFGLQVYCEEKSAASFSDAQTGYWVMLGRNAWNSDANLFTLTTSGITHNHIYGAYEHDSENHWQACACGYTVTEGHKGGEATEEKLPVCEVCGTSYGELADHVHNHQVNYNETTHWTECGCGDVTTPEAHRGGEATETAQAICEVCKQPYGKIKNYAVKLDGDASDWSSEVKAESLKGWHVDADGNTRGLEYYAFVDDQYIYIYTKTITASNAAKGLDIIFNKNGALLDTYLWDNAPGANIVDYYFAQNIQLENGLYQTVAEIVLDKAAYVNSNGKVFVGVWFAGCDDSFEPLSWHEAGKTTIWGLNHRCPWWKGTNHQEVTADGFDHYHDLNADNLCGWCQETIELPITVDGDVSDWDADILANSKTNGSNIYAAGFIDEDHLYLYIEVTQIGDVEPNYLDIQGTNADGIRVKTAFHLYYDDVTPLRPYCNANWACAHYADCDNGYVKYAMTKSTNESGQTVVHYELVIDKDLIAQASGAVWIEVAPNNIYWSEPTTLTNWVYIQVTENGFAN